MFAYWSGAEYGYQVVRVYEVARVDTKVLEHGDAEALTLYACTPRFMGNRRTVVIAEPITGDHIDTP